MELFFNILGTVLSSSGFPTLLTKAKPDWSNQRSQRSLGISRPFFLILLLISKH